LIINYFGKKREFKGKNFKKKLMNSIKNSKIQRKNLRKIFKKNKKIKRKITL